MGAAQSTKTKALKFEEEKKLKRCFWNPTFSKGRQKLMEAPRTLQFKKKDSEDIHLKKQRIPPIGNSV